MATNTRKAERARCSWSRQGVLKITVSLIEFGSKCRARSNRREPMEMLCYCDCKHAEDCSSQESI
jgi:hypothetical protein